MDLVAIRQAIVDILKADPLFEEWEGFPWIVDQFPAPAFFITDFTKWEYDRDFSGAVRFSVAIRYAFPRDNEQEAHRVISRMLSTGPGTPKSILEANPSLNGTVDSFIVARVNRMTRYRAAAGASYLGAEQELDIIAV